MASSSRDSGGAGSSRACGAATSCRSSKEVAAPSSPNGLSRRAPAAAVDGCNSVDPASIEAGAIVYVCGDGGKMRSPGIDQRHGDIDAGAERQHVNDDHHVADGRQRSDGARPPLATEVEGVLIPVAGGGRAVHGLKIIRNGTRMTWIGADSRGTESLL